MSTTRPVPRRWAATMSLVTATAVVCGLGACADDDVARGERDAEATDDGEPADADASSPAAEVGVKVDVAPETTSDGDDAPTGDDSVDAADAVPTDAESFDSACDDCDVETGEGIADGDGDGDMDTTPDGTDDVDDVEVDAVDDVEVHADDGAEEVDDGEEDVGDDQQDADVDDDAEEVVVADTHDDIPPDAPVVAARPATPTLTRSLPGSPSKNTQPTIQGRADAGTTVQLYTDLCTTPIGEAVVAAADRSFAVSVTLPSDARTLFRADSTDAAGTVSTCSDILIYITDNTAPNPPEWIGATPSSPSNVSTPRLQGRSDPDTEVRIFSGIGCSGAFLAARETYSATTFTYVATVDDTTAFFSADARDQAGNRSLCTLPSLVYTHDGTPPPAPFLTGASPSSPSSPQTNPSVTGTIGESGTTILLFADDACGAAAAVATLEDAGTTFSIEVGVSEHTTTWFSARAEDRVGNVSGCSNSISYTLE